MDIILVSKEMSEKNSLSHYRTRGSKNGIRRYQNEDGSLTPEGREHYGVGEGRKKRTEIETESDKQRAKRENQIEKTAIKIEKTQAKIAKNEARSVRAAERSASKQEKAGNLRMKAERKSMKTALKNNWGIDTAKDNASTSRQWMKYIKNNRKADSLKTKSERFHDKAERGKQKLERYRERLERLLPEDVKKELQHAGLSDDFFEMLDNLSEKQRKAIYVLMDDLLEDEGEET